MRRVPSGADFGLDRDRERRADGLAELAGDAALLAVRVAAQRVQAAEARRLRRLLFRVVQRDLAPEEIPHGDRESPQELGEEQRLEE